MEWSYKDIKKEFKCLKNEGDEWGEAMSWLFEISEEIHFKRPSSYDIPWDYEPSCFGYGADPDDYIVQIIKQVSTEDLIKFGKLLSRYCELLRRHNSDW